MVPPLRGGAATRGRKVGRPQPRPGSGARARWSPVSVNEEQCADEIRRFMRLGRGSAAGAPVSEPRARQ